VKSASRPSSSSSTGSDGMQSATPSGLNAAIAAAALACMVRPTNGIVWLTIAGTTMIKYSNYTRSAQLVRSALVVGWA
jgi:hypothetical protein